jgi:L-rhamnonate dehydratase
MRTLWFFSQNNITHIFVELQADKIVPLFGNLFADEPLPANGYVDISDKPGWGVTLNREKLHLKRPYRDTKK